MDIVLTATEINEDGSATNITTANINCNIYLPSLLKAYSARAYATIDAAMLNTMMMANNFVFCAESFGTSVAYVLTTTVNKTMHIAIDT